MNAERMENGVSELRIVTRAVGFLALLTGLLYVRAMIDGGIPAIGLTGVGQGGIFLLSVLLIATVGLLAAWRWEGAGGFIAVASALLVATLIYASAADNGLLAAFVYSSPFLISGALFLCCWWRGRRA